MNSTGLSSPHYLTNEESIYQTRQTGILQYTSPPFKVIDLFCGAGGLSLGFTKQLGHNFQIVYANDNNLPAIETYNVNFGDHCVPGDLCQIIKEDINIIPKADVVIGGPPCQGFSLLNKNRNGDERKQLWRPFLRVVEHSGAQVFLMENVPQLIGSCEHQQIEEVASSLGFKLASARLCAANYGIPQLRWRAFIIGWKLDDPSIAFPPKKTHFKPESLHIRDTFTDNGIGYVKSPKPWTTVRDAIEDLPKPVGTEIRQISPPLNLHFGRSPTQLSIQRYRTIPEEGTNRFDLQDRAPELVPPCWIRKQQGGTDLFGRLWWDRPAVTIRTEFFKPEKGRYLHPSQHRPITHREAARIQSFPDWFQFKGSKIEIAKQIGNAVPPFLAARLADSVFALLMSGAPLNGRPIQSGEAQPDNVEGKRPQYIT